MWPSHMTAIVDELAQERQACGGRFARSPTTNHVLAHRVFVGCLVSSTGSGVFRRGHPCPLAAPGHLWVRPVRVDVGADGWEWEGERWTAVP